MLKKVKNFVEENWIPVLIGVYAVFCGVVSLIYRSWLKKIAK